MKLLKERARAALRALIEKQSDQMHECVALADLLQAGCNDDRDYMARLGYIDRNSEIIEQLIIEFWKQQTGDNPFDIETHRRFQRRRAWSEFTDKAT